MTHDVPITQVIFRIIPHKKDGTLDTPIDLIMVTNFRGDRKFPVKKQHTISGFNQGFWIRPDDFGFSFDVDENDPNYAAVEVLAHNRTMFDLELLPRIFSEAEGESAIRSLSRTLKRAVITGLRDTFIMDDIPAATVDCEFLEYEYSPNRGQPGAGFLSGNGDYQDLESDITSYLG